jgi:preprotein translocase subunit SecY
VLDSFRDAFKLPDLKRRILFTLGVLFIFRLGAHIPTPGIDTAAMARLFEQGAGVLGFLDIFAGGALRRFGIFALGVTPYINSSIVFQLLVVVFPALEKMQKESEDGRKKIIQFTRWGTILFAGIQAVGMTFWLGRLGIFSGGLFAGLIVVLTVTAGAVTVMWLGEEITDHGIGNGISLLIFAGIVARIPEAILRSWQMLRLGEMNILVLILAIGLMFVVIAGCILLQEGQRRLPVQYAKRVVGNKVYGGQSTFIPLKVNQAGVMPIIFASSVLLFPYSIARFFTGNIATMVQKMFEPGSVVYIVLSFLPRSSEKTFTRSLSTFRVSLDLSI